MTYLIQVELENLDPETEKMKRARYTVSVVADSSYYK